MGRKRKERPDGFVLYGGTLKQIGLLPDASAGRVIKAASGLFLSGEDPEGLDLAETLVFSLLSENIMDSLSSFEDTCRRNAENRSRGARVVTSGDQLSPSAGNRIESNQTESNQTESNRKESKADKPPRAARFTPPTVEEVAAYCADRGNKVDAQAFVDHYAANGWMRGKSKIKDWRACVRTWEAQDKKRGGKSSGMGDIRDPSRYQNQEGSL